MAGVLLGDFWQDLRYGLRTLRRSPGFTLLVVVTLGLGIGGNAAIFGLVDAVLLRPLPVRDPTGLVLLSAPTTRGASIGGPGTHAGSVSALSEPLFRELAHDGHFQGLAAEQVGAAEIPVALGAGGGVADLASVKAVTANYFALLGVAAALGRTFQPDDETAPGANPVVVLSHAYWQRRFGGDPSIVGKRVRLQARTYTVIGVAARDFHGTQLGTTVDLWVPLTMEPDLVGGRGHLGSHTRWWLLVLGRLQPGVSRATARASANAVLRGYMATHIPEWPPVQLGVHEGASGFTRFRAGYVEPLWILMAGVGLLMVIVCLNVAHLLLARALARRPEIAIRRALGAGRGRLTRQLLTEGLLLATGGAVAGALAGGWLRDGLLALAVNERAQLALAGGGGARTWSFTALLAVATAVLVGLVPSWRASDLQHPLRAAAGVVGGARPRLSRLLLASQVAGSMVLLVGAGLLAGALDRLRDSDKGYAEDPLLVAQLDTRLTSIGAADAPALRDEIRARLQAVPGVLGVSFAKQGPLNGSRSNCFIVVPGHDVEAVDWEVVTPAFFETMGMRLLGGRDFMPADRAGAPRVVVVNETWVRTFFGAAPPATALGARFRYDPVRDGKMGEGTVEVVGVVRDARAATMTGKQAALMYLPVDQFPDMLTQLQVRAAAGLDPSRLAAQVWAVVSQARPNLTLAWVRTMRVQVDQALLKERLLATLSIAFGLCALFLVSVGLYGVVSQWAAQRTPEIGVRIALGATSGQVWALVMREAFTLVLGGVAVGLPAAIAAAHLLRSRLFGASPVDPLALALAVLLLSAVAALAAFLPARRAARITPMAALRAE